MIDKIFFQINDQYLDIKSKNLNVRSEYQYSRDKWLHYYGIDWSFEDYDVGINLPFFDDDNGEVNNPLSLGDSQKGETGGLWYELGFYSRHQFQKSKTSPWIFTPTMRVDYYKATELGESLFNKLLWQPRLSVQYKLGDYNFFKLATGVYNQLPQEREVNSLSGNPYLKPLVAKHLNLGYEDDLRRGASEGLKVYTGVFYKDLVNLVNTSSRRVNRGGDFVTENFSNESSGLIYGGEAYVQYSNGPWKVNTSYTISKSERTDEEGVKTLSEFDQTMASVESAWKDVDIYTAAQTLKSFGTGIFPSHWLEMSKTRLYEGDISATWTIHRVVRDFLSAFSPICPFFTHYLSTTLYDSSSVDVREFPRLPSFPGSELFEELRDKTESLEEFNSMVWKAKKDRGLSLKSAMSDIQIPESLILFSEALVKMHNLELQ